MKHVCASKYLWNEVGNMHLLMFLLLQQLQQKKASRRGLGLEPKNARGQGRANGKRMWRLLNEMKNYHPEEGIRFDGGDEPGDSAAAVKGTLLRFLKESLPLTKAEVLSRKADALWNRIALQRLNFKGAKVWYAVIRTCRPAQVEVEARAPVEAHGRGLCGHRPLHHVRQPRAASQLF